MRNRKTRYRRHESLSNRFAVIGITLVVICLAIMVHVKCTQLREKERLLIRQEAANELLIAEEESRAQALEEKRVYVQTKEYIEKIAKEKLGLINRGEVILKPSGTN